ncbi:glycogen debranching N-terminal domain-containing protein [Streptosporangium soli]|nr:amylo-alpha-1,6-glucosidase [Streptosporangium sp. KLBMP 9127]
MSVRRRFQPSLHDLVSTVMAPTTAVGGRDGQLRAAGAHGLFHADTRVLSQARLLVDGKEPEAVAEAATGPGVTRFVSILRWLGDDGPDPTVRVERVREVVAGGMSETIEIVSAAAAPVTAAVSMELACDFAPIDRVKSGFAGSAVPVAGSGGGRLVWGEGDIRVAAVGEAARAEGSALVWEVVVAPGERAALRWEVAVTDPGAVVAGARREVEWGSPVVTGADRRVARLLQRSLDDLRSLRMSDAAGDTFLGAGVPWYLTLFGRDAIWAARMMLPLGTELAASTLRVLARRQGTRFDPRSAEEPGKIMHELRRGEFVLTGRSGTLRLPGVYYGTIDATPLWISLLHDAWRWGMPTEEVTALLPNLEAALGWLGRHDGFVAYVDPAGLGLANQGWKDSGDAVRFHDGRRAKPPIALAEVQGYAYQAALHGAALLEAFGRRGAGRWREYAAALAVRFRDRFWVRTPHGRHPALALDGDERPVDSLTSNIGHLLGTGLLSPGESDEVAARLSAPEMSGGFGLRTMSAGDRAFSPMSYHCGSVWTHDTAIVLAALARAGYGEPAARLAESLLAAGEAFAYRLPELYSGADREPLGRPVPYPASCRPQAWSAAAAVAIVHTAVGLHPDVPAGRVALRPLPGAPLGALSVRGLRVAGAEVEVAVDRAGRAVVSGLPGGIVVD